MKNGNHSNEPYSHHNEAVNDREGGGLLPEFIRLIPFIMVCAGTGVFVGFAWVYFIICLGEVVLHNWEAFQHGGLLLLFFVMILIMVCLLGPIRIGILNINSKIKNQRWNS